MSLYTFNNRVDINPDNANEGYNNSWIQVENDANRLLYAQANYITNFEDLEIVLSAKDVRIGAVEISDAFNPDLRVNVVSTPSGGALKVLTQDLESKSDTVSLGDIYNNKVAISIPLSALNVYISNTYDLTSVRVSNQITGYATSTLQTTQNNNLISQIGWLKALSSTRVTVLNSITGFSTDELQQTQISLLNTLTSQNSTNTNNLIESLSSIQVTVINPVTAVSINQPITASLVNPVSTVNFTNTNITVNYGDNSGNLDAFSRLRVSMPTTLFDSKTLHNKASLFWNSLTYGSGASIDFTGDSVDASVTLSTNNPNEYAIRQTNQRFNYQPGKSQLALFTGVLKPETDAVKRYGLFQSLTSAPYTPNVGLYFETQTTSPTSIAVVQANEGYLVPSLSATRENWNIDKLDGTGPSGKVLQLSAANIFLIDFEWLGVGRVRYGTVIDGQICYCHQFNNAGNVAGTYIRTPNLPLRAELRQLGTGYSSMKMICTTVMSEGGEDFTGATRAVDSGTAAIIGVNTRRALLGLRLQYNKLDSVNELLNASALVLASNQGNAASACFKYEIIINPTLTTPGTWTDVDTNSNFQVWRGNSAINAPGTVVAAGFSGAGAEINLSGLRFEKFLRMGCTIDGVRDEVYLVITPLQANDGVFGSLTFIESD